MSVFSLIDDVSIRTRCIFELVSSMLKFQKQQQHCEWQITTTTTRTRKKNAFECDWNVVARRACDSGCTCTTPSDLGLWVHDSYSKKKTTLVHNQQTLCSQQLSIDRILHKGPLTPSSVFLSVFKVSNTDRCNHHNNGLSLYWGWIEEYFINIIHTDSNVDIGINRVLFVSTASAQEDNALSPKWWTASISRDLAELWDQSWTDYTQNIGNYQFPLIDTV